MYAVEAPGAVRGAVGGLLPLANVIDDAPGHLFLEGVTYQESTLNGHNRVVPTDGSDKVFDQVGIREGEKFSVYRGVEFSMFQQGLAGPTAEQAFGAGESYAVERAVQELQLNTLGVDITPTAGTPVTDVLQAIGLLEQYAADQYSGRPLFHVNRLGASILGEQLESGDEDNGWKLHTKQGTPVANGGGYQSEGPEGALAPAGAFWLYVSGQVNVWRGKVNVADAPMLYENRAYALAEATYVASVDSFVGAVLVGV